MTAQFLGALMCWLLKGCRTNFFKQEYIGDKETRNMIVGFLTALLLVGLGILLVKFKILPLDF